MAPDPRIRPLLMCERGLRGGAQTSTVMLAEALTRRGYDTTLTFGYPGPLADDARAQGVRLVPTPSEALPRALHARMAWLTAYAAMARRTPVHVNSLQSRCVAVGLAARRFGVPVIGHLRTPAELDNAERLHRAGAYIITNSSATERELRRRGATRVRFVPNGQQPDTFVPARTRAEVLAEAGLDPEGSVAIVVANVWPHKALDLLLPGLLEAMAANPGLQLLHVGAVHMESMSGLAASLRSLVDQAGMTRRVAWMGSRSDIADLTAAADMCLVPSRGEGTARVILEGWSLEKPVVAADVDGLNDLVDDGENGLLVDLHDTGATARAIESLVRDPALAQRLAKQGHEDVTTRYSHDAHVDRVLEVYREVTARRSFGRRAGT